MKIIWIISMLMTICGSKINSCILANDTQLSKMINVLLGVIVGGVLSILGYVWVTKIENYFCAEQWGNTIRENAGHRKWREFDKNTSVLFNCLIA